MPTGGFAKPTSPPLVAQDGGKQAGITGQQTSSAIHQLSDLGQRAWPKLLAHSKRVPCFVALLRSQGAFWSSHWGGTGEQAEVLGGGPILSP